MIIIQLFVARARVHWCTFVMGFGGKASKENHGTRAAVRLEQLARIDSVRLGTVRPSKGSAKNKQLRLLTRNYHIISANDGLLIMEIESEKERKRDSDAASGTGGVGGYSVKWTGGARSLKCLPEFGGSPTRLRLRKGRLATWTQSDVQGRGY